jgi:uncharacterized membrane protein YdjX (TVP38/TMEM64 family)
MKKNVFNVLKNVLTIIFFFLIGALGIVFTILCLNTFDEGFFYYYSDLIRCISVLIITILTIVTISFFINSKEIIYKFCLLITATVAIVTICFYFLSKSGFLDRIDSVEDFRKYISSFGSWTIIVYVFAQMLQVAVLPVPAFIFVGAGVLMYGPFLASVLSCIGIIAGSIIAFFIGRIFGYKVVKWLVGQNNLDKCLKFIKGKDKVIFTAMFLFPFFPDDVLCFVAGITTMSPLFFIVMISIVRLITVFLSCYSMNNSLIPYNTWWGILLWALFFIITLLIVILIFKKGDKIQKLFKRKKDNKNLSK